MQKRTVAETFILYCTKQYIHSFVHDFMDWFIKYQLLKKNFKKPLSSQKNGSIDNSSPKCCILSRIIDTKNIE